MNRTFATAIITLLTMTAPARAAIVETLDANLNLNFQSDTLTGTIEVVKNPFFNKFGVNYFLSSSDLSLDGTHLTTDPNNLPLEAFPGTIGWFSPLPGTNQPIGLSLHSSDGQIPPDPTYQSFGLLFFPNDITTGGTVTITSETFATPLPDALPLFACGIVALGGFAAVRRSRRAARA